MVDFFAFTGRGKALKFYIKKLVSVVLAAEIAALCLAGCGNRNSAAASGKINLKSSEKVAKTIKVSSSKDFDIDNGVLIAYRGSGGNVTIPDGVTEIGMSAFENSNISSVTIPESVTKIDEEAFFECNKLTNVTIPKSVTEIGGCSFLQCENLKSVTISKGVEKINGNAFSQCKKLTDIKVPEGVTDIGPYAFDYCDSLANITIPKSVIQIGVDAFHETAWLKNYKTDFVTVNNILIKYKGNKSSVEIPSGITK
jgi:hypothetical protein